LFAGVSLEGSTLRADGSANEKLYGRRISARRFVQQPGPGPVKAGELLVATLQKVSPKNESDPASLKNAPSR
jgi:lipid-binding SYLF domain-containing protein